MLPGTCKLSRKWKKKLVWRSYGILLIPLGRCLQPRSLPPQPTPLRMIVKWSRRLVTAKVLHQVRFTSFKIQMPNLCNHLDYAYRVGRTQHFTDTAERVVQSSTMWTCILTLSPFWGVKIFCSAPSDHLPAQLAGLALLLNHYNTCPLILIAIQATWPLVTRKS